MGSLCINKKEFIKLQFNKLFFYCRNPQVVLKHFPNFTFDDKSLRFRLPILSMPHTPERQAKQWLLRSQVHPTKTWWLAK